MIRRLSLPVLGLVCATLPFPRLAVAQLALPGAAPSTGVGSPAGPPPKVKKKGASGPQTQPGGKAAKLPAPGIDGIAGQKLMLNGKEGLLEISGSGDALQIDKLSLAGEGVTDSSQRCEVDIVGEKPIAATKIDSPDGLSRFQADVPACPFTFDLVSGAVLVPSQITACVFKAADCQTSPGGLWGPDGAALEPQAEAIGKRRSAAEKAMAKAIREIEPRAKDNADVASLLSDQKGFAGQRDEACRAYDKEAVHGFCAANLTQARAAMIEARLEALGAPRAAPAAKNDHKKAKAKKKSGEAIATPAPDAAPQ